jgi:hypothetical protein
MRIQSILLNYLRWKLGLVLQVLLPSCDRKGCHLSRFLQLGVLAVVERIDEMVEQQHQQSSMVSCCAIRIDRRFGMAAYEAHQQMLGVMMLCFNQPVNFN